MPIVAELVVDKVTRSTAGFGPKRSSDNAGTGPQAIFNGEGQLKAKVFGRFTGNEFYSDSVLKS